MFGIDSSEFLVIVIVAVIVIGPKDLPRALYKVGQIVGKAQAMARHFRTGIDAMVREVEVEELEKKWAEQNRRIMAEHPPETHETPNKAQPLSLTSSENELKSESQPHSNSSGTGQWPSELTHNSADHQDSDGNNTPAQGGRPA